MVTMQLTSLKDKVVLVTGASSGIGKATAITFAQAGSKIALIARREDKLRSVANTIQARGGQADFYVANVGRESEALAAAAWAEKTFGKVDILINNAGIIRPGQVASADTQSWRDTFDINLLAPMYMTQALLAGMQQKQAGHIINISSNAAKQPGAAGNSAYSASKYGITALSVALRKEVAEYGIRVTIVEPGTTETDIADTIADEAARAKMDSHMHREGVMQVEDIANAILYAASQPQRVNVDELWLTPTQ